jgi:signal transduction histidine kinase
MKASTQPRWRAGVLLAVIVGVSVLHYQTPTTHVWLHPLFQRAYYVPILLMALFFGLRGGILAASLSGLLYLPHIFMAWTTEPEYRAAQFIEVAMFFVIGGLTGVLADHERFQRKKVEETARKLSDVYAQLQASFEQLRRADRLSALGELSAGLAHEIRNPLGSIEGAMQILCRTELPAETRQEFGDLGQKEVNRLKGLLTNFLDFARPQTPRRSPTEPLQLLESVGRLAAETAKMSGVQVRIESADGVAAVALDPEQMKQVLLNLVINAIQAMPAGGEVVLRTLSKTDAVVLEVQDEGTGIPLEDLERVFNPFVTTRPGGTGLGLSIAYQIVSQHGGHIAARRNPERGMTFAVALPLSPDGNRSATALQDKDHV